MPLWKQRHAQEGHTWVSGVPHLSALLANAPLVLALAKGLVELLRDDCPLALAIPLHEPAGQQGGQADGPADHNPHNWPRSGSAARLPLPLCRHSLAQLVILLSAPRALYLGHWMLPSSLS